MRQGKFNATLQATAEECAHQVPPGAVERQTSSTALFGKLASYRAERIRRETRIKNLLRKLLLHKRTRRQDDGLKLDSDVR